MSLYQSSVLNKYLADQDQEKVKSAFNEYKNYFLNTDIQQNIRNSKEEQFQEGFLRELFVNILGYTINPNPNFNLTTELKNIKNARKTDGAILKADGAALAVIELKGTNTKDLDKVNDQAFNYKNNQPDCVYVITSNFEKLRFFIHNAVEHEEFNLFALTKERFALLWLFLQKDNLLSGIPAKVKEESLLQEDKITKALYADYSAFKNDLWNDMVQQNPQHEPLLLYKKSQKLLDRFLFIFFSEDKGLLPPNSISVIIEQWQKLKDLDEYKPLYDRFKKYFGYMNDGYKGVKYEIHAYNGGLFKTDELLDGLLIDDELLKKHSLKLTNYDFDDEIDTNILGHIFEHSLNDIENVRAILAGEEIDKSKSKRKKDGVFYTPKYITKYIVDNTVGKLCEEKKGELELVEEEYARDSKGRRKATLKKLDAKLKDYRKWLLQLTICDPACGSGAFLNQALEFLMAEHLYIDELEAQLIDGSIVFQDVENHILEHNIFGVDINEESVEIARLSLWLRTAKKGRKLTSLSSNIKCGNSLIDDPGVAGDLAFNWQEQFPKVFTKGGFDVVIGNPPYVNISNIEDALLRKHYQTQFKTFKNKCDLYSLFIERSIGLGKKDGEQGFIFPNSWLGTSSFSRFREMLSTQVAPHHLVELPSGVFSDAIVTTVIIAFRNSKTTKGHQVGLYHLEQQMFFKQPYTLDLDAVKKTESFAYSFALSVPMRNISKKLGEIAEFSLGIKTSDDKRFVFDYKKDDSAKPLLRGKDIGRYHMNYQNMYLWYMPNLIKEKAGGRPRILEHYLKPKIVIQDVAKSIRATYDDDRYLVNDTINIIHEVKAPFQLHSLLAILNSKLCSVWFNSCFPEGLHIKINQLQEIPIPNLKNEDFAFLSESAKLIIEENSKFNSSRNQLIDLLQSKFEIQKPSIKLRHWPSLDFKGFLAELKKAKVPKLSLDDEAEWMEYFNKKKAEANALQTEIDSIDKQIDQMVYKLYGLTEDEIKIVEESTK